MLKKILFGLSAAVLMSSQAMAQTQPQLEYQQKHGDWMITCHLIDEAKEVRDCIITTGTTTKVETPQGGQEIDAARASVIYIQDQPTLILTALPGTLLLPGMGINIDGKPLELGKDKIDQLYFERCLNDGCITGLPLATDEIVASLKKSNTMNLSYNHDLLGKGLQELKLKVSMKGFTAAYDDLQKRMGKAK